MDDGPAGITFYCFPARGVGNGFWLLFARRLPAAAAGGYQRYTAPCVFGLAGSQKAVCRRSSRFALHIITDGIGGGTYPMHYRALVRADAHVMGDRGWLLVDAVDRYY